LSAIIDGRVSAPSKNFYKIYNQELLKVQPVTEGFYRAFTITISFVNRLNLAIFWQNEENGASKKNNS